MGVKFTKDKNCVRISHLFMHAAYRSYALFSEKQKCEAPR